jgi:hypothetical protein
MATIIGLQEKLKDLRKVLAGAKGGLEKGRPKAGKYTGEEWLDYTQETLDNIRKEVNRMIKYIDKIIGQ